MSFVNKAPGLNSLVLYVLVFQDKPDVGGVKYVQKYVRTTVEIKKNGWKWFIPFQAKQVERKQIF